MDERLVDEQIDVPANGTCLIADAAIEFGLLVLEFRKCCLNGIGGNLYLSLAPALVAQRVWNLNGDRHRANSQLDNT